MHIGSINSIVSACELDILWSVLSGCIVLCRMLLICRFRLTNFTWL